VKALAESLLGLVPSGVEFADVRVVLRRHECVHADAGAVTQVLWEESEGVAVRVLVDGQWGFAATTYPEHGEAALGRAVAQARAAAALGGPRARLSPAESVVARYRTPVARDPFTVPLDEKAALLVAASEALGPGLRGAEASYDCFQETKLYASTEGACVEQVLTETGAGLLATALSADELQRRSYPQSVPRSIKGQRGDFATAGWEHVESLRLLEEAPRVGDEARALLTAPVAPSGKTTLIVGGTAMALLVHETYGHPAELDRVLGSEASLAGGSYMQPELVGKLRVGSQLVNVTADATLPGGMGSYGYDDEGVPAQRTVIVEDGVFRGYLTGRESAAALGVRSSGAARADGWARIPLVRMSNVSIEPGETPYEELVASTKEGILVDMNRSVSIDDTRRAFRFGNEAAWEIKDGKVGRLLRNATFSGRSIEFWQRCDAVADRASFRVYGIPSCNKGEPLQVAHVGHGTVPARFRDVQVGTT
jgi:TldD protein